MKKNFLPIIAAGVCLVFLAGCAQKSVIDKNDVSSEAGTQENAGDAGDAQYKLLYNPPAGGSPENIGKIVFASNPADTPNADYDLFSIDPDGSNKKQLTHFGKYINDPVWSPERSRIAYSAWAEGNQEKIFIMTADGSESRQLTFGGFRDKFPTWSPDGKQIAYISYIDNTPNLFVMDIYGKNIKQLTFVDGKNTVLWPSWSPVSDVIAFSFNKAGEDVDFRLHIIKANGTGEKEILSSSDKDLGDHEPAWSPDGKKMYFLSNRNSRHIEIWKIDYDKWEQKIAESNKINYEDIGLAKISNLYSVNVNADHRPRVSPDGKKIVFYGVGSDWNNIGSNLYTLNVDGSGLENITKSKDNDEWPDW
jgi:Tol biopolymer transport system component